jgi:hypothetical protein
MATTKVKQSTRTLGTGEVAIGNISGSAAASAGTFLKQDGTWAVASTVTDVTGLQNDIATLALHSAIQNNQKAYNLSNAFVDQYEDSTGIDVETLTARSASGEYVSTQTTVAADGNTALLISSNTTNGSTVFTDSSTNAQTITVGGDTEHSTAYSKFGTSSIKFDGTGDYLTVPYNVVNTVTMPTGNAARTVDFWFRPTVAAGDYVFSTGVGSGANTLFSLSQYLGNYYFQGYGAGDMGTGFAVTINTWAHVAIVKDASTVYVFIDGDLKASGAKTLNTTGTILSIGCYSGGSFPSNFAPLHYQDEFRVSNIARWTSNFTPPTSPYGETTNATGNYTSSTETASATVSKMGIVVLYKNADGTTTLDTDLVAQVSADGGANYVSAPLTAGGTFSAGINIAKSNDITISNTGTAPKFKISFANQAAGSKFTQVHGVALLY